MWRALLWQECTDTSSNFRASSCTRSCPDASCGVGSNLEPCSSLSLLSIPLFSREFYPAPPASMDYRDSLQLSSEAPPRAHPPALKLLLFYQDHLGQHLGPISRDSPRLFPLNPYRNEQPTELLITHLYSFKTTTLECSPC